MQDNSTMPAGDFDYDRDGAGYTRHRRPDPTIAALVTRGLGDSRTVINVGAGAGSYEPGDRYVAAVEPSAQMRALRPASSAPAIDAVAEQLPFDDDAFDAAMAMITVHQWPDKERGLRELRRVTRGPVVVLTFDGGALDAFWLAAYAPELIAAERLRYPAIDQICAILGGDCAVDVVPIPIDCTDGFTEAYYARPEAFLDDTVRAGQSAWGFITPDEQHRAVATLADDLGSGAWDAAHGELRTQPVYTGSLRLVVSPG